MSGPVLNNLANATYTENGAAVTLSGNLTITDPDSATLDSATISISGGRFAGDGDVLAASVVGTSITASYNPSTETLTLSGTDTLADYRAVLDSLVFSSTSNNPTNFGSNTTRTVTWSANDGTFASVPQTTTVTINPINNAPSLSSVAPAVALTQFQ